MKRLISLACMTILLCALFACAPAAKPVKLGVSLGVGNAIRWEEEKAYMEECAKELGVGIEVRLNRTDTPLTQQEDCFEMIDSGIDVLILTPRNTNDVDEILAYAHKKKVPVVSYARIILDERISLFVGYDVNRMGQKMGQYASESVYQGDYIILRGDEGDNNSNLIYEGTMRYIEPLDKINILLDAPVPNWSPDAARVMVLNAIKANHGRIDAIIAPNDALAGTCAQVLQELGITHPVVITGMDAELDALRRIVQGKQSMTLLIYLDELARNAVIEATHIARREPLNINGELDNQSGGVIPSNLIAGQMITKENLDRIIIQGGYYTKEEIYG